MRDAISRGLRTVLVAAMTAISVTALTSQEATAAENPFLSCKYSGSGNDLKWSNATTRYEYSNPAQVAIESWNSTSTQFNFANVNTGANLRVADGNFGDTGYDGVTYSTCSGGYHQTTVVSWWNRYVTDGYSGPARKSVMVHEIGHALGLSDLHEGSSCSTRTIMYFSSARYEPCGLIDPTPTDVSRVNSLY
ncbi:hypothetical protein [Streptomyces sp. NPDC001500]